MYVILKLWLNNKYLKNLFQPQSFARLNFTAAISGITEIRNLGLR